MNKKTMFFTLAVFLLGIWSLSWGQALTASSDPFTFPVLTDVKNGTMHRPPGLF
jgi:hypothetical protein